MVSGWWSGLTSVFGVPISKKLTDKELEEMRELIDRMKSNHSLANTTFGRPAIRTPQPTTPWIPSMNQEQVTGIAVEILKQLIVVRDVTLELDGLDEALVAQAFKYAELVSKEDYKAREKQVASMQQSASMQQAAQAAQATQATYTMGIRISPTAPPRGGGTITGRFP